MNTKTIDVLLKEQGDRQRIADIVLGRSRADRVMRWLPAPVGVAVVVALSAWGGAQSSGYSLVIALAALNLVGLAVAQGQAARRINAIAAVLERTGALDEFLTSDRVAVQTKPA